MRIIFLGTNGWFETSTGNTLCVLIKTEKYDIILDAGSGFFRLDRFIDGTKPVFLLLSHFHIDHISGLHGLSKVRCKAGLTIAGQEGTREVISTIVNKPFTIPLADLSYRTEVLELPRDHGSLPFSLEYLPMVHSDPCLGFRVTADSRSVAFCTDTGYCENAVKLGHNADLLITECAFLPGQENSSWPHLNPETAARIAAEAGASRLVLAHFDAARYLSDDDRIIAENKAREVFINTTAARDFMELVI